MLESWQLWLYHLEGWATQLVNDQLQHLSVLSFGVMALAGLLTSLSPCMLSMLPITVGYIGGYSERRQEALLQSSIFAGGVALTLTALGLGSAFLGRVYGQQAGGLWPLLMGSLAIVMGLNLLQVLPLRLPDLGSRLRIPQEWPQTARSLLLGLTFGLVASPCSTPVLIALLGWVSTAGNPAVGAGVLLAYALGLVSPLIVAGVFTSSVKKLLGLRQWSSWLTTGSGILLIGFGSLTVFGRLLA